MEATLIGYDLYKFLDGSHPVPSPTVTVETKSNPNPAYLTWVRQDKLLFGAFLGTLEQTLVPLVSRSTTCKEAWDTLANTFAHQSRGHIKSVKANLKAITKGPQTITEYMNAIKICTDQLALLGEPMHPEDITDKVLEHLDSNYQGVIDAVYARDTPITFDELHEKLINRELTVKAQPALLFLPVSAHVTTTRHPSQNQFTTYLQQHPPNQDTRHKLIHLHSHTQNLLQFHTLIKGFDEFHTMLIIRFKLSYVVNM